MGMVIYPIFPRGNESIISCSTKKICPVLPNQQQCLIKKIRVYFVDYARCTVIIENFFFFLSV